MSSEKQHATCFYGVFSRKRGYFLVEILEAEVDVQRGGVGGEQCGDMVLVFGESGAFETHLGGIHFSWALLLHPR